MPLIFIPVWALMTIWFSSHAGLDPFYVNWDQPWLYITALISFVPALATSIAFVYAALAVFGVGVMGVGALIIGAFAGVAALIDRRPRRRRRF